MLAGSLRRIGNRLRINAQLIDAMNEFPLWSERYDGEMEDVFAVMCCTKPRRGCAVGVAGARQDALKSVQKTFADAGYSNCSLRYYLSAATGKKD